MPGIMKNKKLLCSVCFPVCFHVGPVGAKHYGKGKRYF